jgi:hypothetical protein
MYDDDSRGTHSQDLILGGVEPIETIEDLLRKCDFFDSVAPKDRVEEILAREMRPKTA